MATSYPTPVGANPTGGPILPGQNLDNLTNTPQPQTPATVPTKAPAVPATATNQPPVTPTTQSSVPTAVVSSGTAANHVNNSIVPTMNQGQTDLQNQQNAQKATNLFEDQAKAANQGKPGFDVLGNPIPTPPTPKTPEQQIADTPDVGHQWIYDTQGNRTQIPIGSQIPPNYSTTNPTTGPTAPAVDTTTDTVGNKYVQLSDGTYGKYNAVGQYIGTTTADEFNQNKDGQSILNNLHQLVNGTYPLTASQQAQVDGLKAQFQQLIEQQKVANANFTGGTTVAENLYGMGNSITGLGEIKGSVDAGIAKIADLNSKMSTAVSQMTAGFQSDNLNLMKTAYGLYNDAAKSRQDEIDKLNQVATDAKNKAQDEADKQQQYQLDVSKFNEAQSNDTFSQNLQTNDYDLKVKDFNEKVKTDAFDRAYKMEDLKLKQQNNAILVNPPVTVPTTATGKPDPVKQQAYLDTLPGGANGATATAVKGLASYALLPTSFSPRAPSGGGPSQRQQFVTLALQYDPTYQENLATQRAAYLKSIGSGTFAQGVLSANKALAHLNTFDTDVTALGNGTVSGGFNALKNIVSSNSPFNSNREKIQQNLGEANTVASGLKDEMAKYFKGTGTTDVGSIDTWAKRLDVNAPPGSQKGIVQGALDLFTGQFNTIQQQYQTVMGKPADPGVILQPQTVQVLSKLKDKGYNIDIPGIPYSDKDAYIKNTPNAQENLSNAYTMLKNAGIPTTPDNILQAAQLNQ